MSTRCASFVHSPSNFCLTCLISLQTFWISTLNFRQSFVEQRLTSQRKPGKILTPVGSSRAEVKPRFISLKKQTLVCCVGGSQFTVVWTAFAVVGDRSAPTGLKFTGNGEQGANYVSIRQLERLLQQLLAGPGPNTASKTDGGQFCNTEVVFLLGK